MFYGKWHSLAINTRVTIAKQFGVAKTGPTHVQDNRVVQDGYDFSALERALTIPAMQEYSGLESDNVLELFQAVCDRAEGKLPTPVGVPETIQVEPVVSAEAIETAPPVPTEEPKRRGRAKKVVQ